MEAAKIYTGTNNTQFKIPSNIKKFRGKKTAASSNRT